MVDYVPNALGQPSQAGSYATGVSYYPNGAIKGFSYGNGVVHTLTQNARQLPSKSTDCTASGSCAAANRRLDLAYSYDGNGNVTQIVDGVNGRQTRGMSYDGLDRLTQTTSSMFGTASYAYDVLDNLAQVSVGGGSQVRNHYYCYDAAWRLTNVKTGNCSGTSVVGLGYDVQGNLVNKNGQVYVFDQGNRLREASGKEWYGYDGQGRRVLGCSPTACAYQQYSLSGQPLYSHDNRQGKQYERIYLGGSLVAIREAPTGGGTTTVRYQHTDALGTPIATTDASKNVVDQFEYEPYGQLVNATLRDGPGYTGHVQDAATGLTYMQQRYYDPAIGAFLSVDPVTAYSNPVLQFNRYRYANGNPSGFTDPDGRQANTCSRLGANDCSGTYIEREVRSPGPVGDVSSQGGRSQKSSQLTSTPTPAQSGRKGQVTSAFTGDTKPTFTYAAAYGVGVKAELKEGPNNDRYSITTPALGVTATGTWNVVTASYDFLPSHSSSPVDVGFNLGGEIGLIGVVGGGLRYTPPAKFEISINAGFGAAARVEMFEVGLTPGKFP